MFPMLHVPNLTYWVHCLSSGLLGTDPNNGGDFVSQFSQVTRILFHTSVAYVVLWAVPCPFL